MLFFNLYAANTASIEVLYNNKLLNLHFPILPICFLLDIYTRTNFIEKMDRTHHDKKLKYIVEESKNLFIFINTHYTFNKVVGRVHILLSIFKHINLWKELLYICAYICNFIIIFSYSSFPKYETEKSLDGIPEGMSRSEYIRLYLPSLFNADSFSIHTETIYAFNCIGVIQLFIFAVVIIHHIFNNMVTQFKVIKSRFEERQLNTIKNVFYLFRWIRRPIKKYDVTNFFVFLKLFEDFETIYYTICCIFTTLGLIYHPFFYIFNITNLFYKSETLRILVTSLYISRKILLNILLMYCLILYIVALINFVVFWDQYKPMFYCETNMYMCLFNMICAPFKNTDYFFLVDKTNKDKLFDIRFFFDIFYLIFMTIYVILFPALMIDTFKIMSRQAKRDNYDKLNTCSICNYDIKEIECFADYHEHIFIKHNLWNYVYFIIYLLSKSKNELNTLQKYLLYQIINNRHSWIPSKSNGYDITKE
jgi:hypothetical protein